MSPPPPQIRILCFGASITAGFYRFGLAHHPYAKRLLQVLQTALPTTKIEVDIDALSGDRVIGGRYFERLAPHLPKNKNPKQNEPSLAAAEPYYDWIIIQAGGNDLFAPSSSPAAIFTALKSLWRLCLSKNSGTKILALTVTETSNHQSPRIAAKYEELNRLIREHESGGEERFFVADVCKAVPWVGVEERERRKVWDDGLHFRPEGYDRLGDAVAGRLLEIMGVGEGDKGVEGMDGERVKEKL